MTSLSFLRKDNKGFSLIEIIMVLVLLGIMGALGSVGLTSFIEIFSRSKQSNDAVSAGQIAILRIAKELIAVKDLHTNDSNSTKIKFTTTHNDGNYTIEIYKDANGVVKLNGDKLVESVDSLEFEYYVWDSDCATTPFLSETPLWTDDRCSISIAKATFDNDANTTTFEISSSNIDSIPTNHFKIKFADNTTTTQTSTPGDNETYTYTTMGDACQYAYLYDNNRTDKTMCFFKIAITGDSTNNTTETCYNLPAMDTDITGHTVTRIIKVTLKLQA